MIKAIIFDYGGVLIDRPDPFMYEYYAKHLKTSTDDFLKEFAKYETGLFTGKISEDKFWESISADLHVTKPNIKSLWLKGELSVYREKKEIFSLIKNLKKQGYTIVFLSNAEFPIRDYIKTLSWKDFDLFIFSCEVGFRKPDREIFDVTIKKLRINANEAIFIDDREDNIKGGEIAGIRGIWFKDSNQLKTDLVRFGIKV